MIRNRLSTVAMIATCTSGCAGHLPRQIDLGSQTAQPQQERKHEINPSETNPAIIVHIDPQTGQIIVPPATPSPGQVPPSPLGTPEKPLPQLQQELSPVPGGGVMIQLDDRFRTPLTATIDADGRIRFEHKHSASGANQKE